MASITTWVRLEPRPRDGALEESLQAQVRDPLWLLARQWQFGEFRGENGGSLVRADLVIETGQMTRYSPGPWRSNGRGVAYDPLKMPLETLVEAEPARHENRPDYRHSARAGQMFLGFLREASAQKFAAGFVTGFALPAAGPGMDEETRRFLRVITGKVPDGAALRTRFPADRRMGDPLTQVPPGGPGEPFTAIETEGGQARADFLTSARKWLDWYDGLVTHPAAGTAWVDERMEYAFSLSTPYQDGSGRSLELTAAEYPGGHIDWHAFDVHNGPGPEGALTRQPLISVLPTPVEFRGMPASRFWQFEEGQVDFGGIETAPEDLGKMLFAEFALVFGNDFFYIPVTLPVGSISRVVSLKVRDTFTLHGEAEMTIPAASQVDGQASDQPPWRLFCLSPTVETGGAAPEYMFLPPSLIHSLQGPPIEEVLLLRDEMANMAWAVERLVLNPAGKTINRFEEYQLELQKERERREEAVPGSTAPAGAPLTYRLFTAVPDYWNPMLLSGGPGARRFNLKGTDDVRGALLDPYVQNSSLRLFEEEVPRSGVRLTRACQSARWTDGSRHLWVGRMKQPGRGEGSSGLQFDTLKPETA